MRRTWYLKVEVLQIYQQTKELGIIYFFAFFFTYQIIKLLTVTDFEVSLPYSHFPAGKSVDLPES